MLLDLQFLDEDEEKLFHEYEYFGGTENKEPGCFDFSDEGTWKGYVCTRIQGHSGRHAATSTEGQLIKSWKNLSLEDQFLKLAAPEFFT